jgi:hypothetical protein
MNIKKMIYKFKNMYIQLNNVSIIKAPEQFEDNNYYFYLSINANWVAIDKFRTLSEAYEVYNDVLTKWKESQGESSFSESI